MKQLLKVFVAACVIAGCNAADDVRPEGDTATVVPTSVRPGAGAGRRAWIDSTRGPGRESMMTGNMATDISTMNAMMLAHIDGADPLYDLRFLHMMIPHHEGAIAMAEDALSKASHPEVKELARSMIASQAEEIVRMKNWLIEWYGDSAATGGLGIGRGGRGAGGMRGNRIDQVRDMNSKMVAHLGMADAAYDKRFLDMMIPHHQGGVDMARSALQHASHPELKALAKTIVVDQEKEIAEMHKWRGMWYPH